MNLILRSAAVALLSFAASFATAQTKPAGSMPRQAAADNSPIIADVQFDSIPLTDVIDYLRDTTNRNIVLMPAPGFRAENVPVSMKLRNVSLAQILEVLKSLPTCRIEYTEVGEGESAITTILVSSPDNNPGMVPGGEGNPFAMPGGPMAAQQPNEQSFLSVLSLERMLLGDDPAMRVPDAAERAKLLDERTKQALSILDQSFAMLGEDGSKPEVKVHAETHTLLVKATAKQLGTIQQVLEALQVPESSEFKQEYTSRIRQAQQALEEQKRSMDGALRSAEDRAGQAAKLRDELEAKNHELIAQIEQLRAKLEALQAQQKPQ
jgi:hypothetical protein